MKWKNKGHEFDGWGKRFDNNKKHYIWGAGTFGQAFYEDFCNEFNISGFIDKNPQKQGKKFCGLDVISPTKFREIYKKGEIVLVSTGFTASVYKQLEEQGLSRYKDYYHIDEYSSVYMMYKYDKIYVSDVVLGITQKCTLRCEYCNAFIPQIKKPVDVSFSEIKEDLASYFNWVDEVNVLGLCGGDAMSHSEFSKILQWIGETYYPGRVKHLEVYSNAVIVPSADILKLFKKYDVFYRFTDYSGNSGVQHISEVTSLLEENEIRFDHVRFDEWYDCGYPQMSNGITSEEGLINFFNKCDRKTCHGVKDKKLFFCSMCVGADVIDYCKIEKDDYFDLTNFDSTRRKEFLEYYLGFCEKGYFNYCKKCNGGVNVNKHSIPVGKQII